MPPLRLSIFGLIWLKLSLIATAYSPDATAGDTTLSEHLHFEPWLIMGLLVLIMGGLLIHLIRLNSRLHRSETRYRLLAENAHDVIWFANMDGQFTYISPSVERMRGYTVEEALQQRIIDIVDPDSQQEVAEAFEHMSRTGELLKHHWLIEQPCKDGSQIATEVIVNLVHNKQGQVQEIFGITRDVSERQQHEQRLQTLAHFDNLTGLPNRSLFFDRLDQAIHMARRQQMEFSLLFIDLDGFKEANDTHGHDFGDRVLQEVAQRLSLHVRESDTVARVGGDEFTVILNHLKPGKKPESVLQAMLHSLSQPYHFDGKVSHLSASIGISLFPNDGEQSDLLIKHADTAMYDVKRNNKNGYRYYQKN
jgi:diguanylate cyclase (GGDEF)-like protein/PAS domain S-box-containing protein